MRELRERVRELLRVAKELKKREVPFEIIGAYLNDFVAGMHINGGRYAYYIIVKVKPHKTPYYIYSTTSEFSFCPLNGNFCSCGMGITEDENCFKEARKKNRIRLTVDNNLISILEPYSDDLFIRVRYYELDEDTKEWLWGLGFLYDEMHF